jgi:hypothetical protein
MGNRFGRYETREDAARALFDRGFGLSNTEGIDFYTKPSTNTFGQPMVAVVEIEEAYVAPEYTASGERETYYQHHYL